jgi:ADP-ribose pyrophosphatase
MAVVQIPSEEEGGRRVEVLEKSIVFDDFFRIEAATLRFQRFDGSLGCPVRRLSFLRGDSAAALLYNPSRGTLLLVNQFKYPTLSHGSGWITELVAGGIGDSENPADAVQREILEETGYQVSELHHLTTFYVSPGGTSERIWLYLGMVSDASRIAPGGGLSSEDEDIEVVELPLQEACAAVRQGGISDAKTIVAILWLALWQSP